jgi:hypothetical protein
LSGKKCCNFIVNDSRRPILREVDLDGSVIGPRLIRTTESARIGDADEQSDHAGRGSGDTHSRNFNELARSAAVFSSTPSPRRTSGYEPEAARCSIASVSV